MAQALSPQVAAKSAISTQDIALLSAVGHELKRPLFTIQATALALQQQHLSADAQDEFLQRIELQAQRAVSLLDSFMYANALIRGYVPSQPAPSSIAASLDSVVSTASGLAARYGVSIDVHCKTRATAYVDGTALRYSLAAIIDAVIRSTESEVIAVSVSGARGGVEIVLRDTGAFVSEASIRNAIAGLGSGPKAQAGSAANIGFFVWKTLSTLQGIPVSVRCRKSARTIRMRIPVSQQLELF